MSNIRLDILNEKEVIDTYTRLPVSIKAEMKKALRQAAKPAVSEIKASLSQKSKRSVKANIYGKKDLLLVIGLFRNNKSTGLDRYFIEYWKEYGTLSRRSASHRFAKPRKRITANWKGGITPQNKIDPLLDRKLPEVVNRAREILKTKRIEI